MTTQHKSISIAFFAIFFWLQLFLAIPQCVTPCVSAMHNFNSKSKTMAVLYCCFNGAFIHLGCDYSLLQKQLFLYKYIILVIIFNGSSLKAFKHDKVFWGMMVELEE